ncbi:MAG: hypothetical protein LBO82_05440 [Synergistaceae bacterium]|nr:hypothetical protein [Synergistaceae bacterium]
MKKFLPAFLGFALLGGLLFLHPAEGASKNGVVSFSPSGTAADNAALRIVFDEPVVSKNEIGQALPVSDFPFVTAPPIQAEGKWLDRRTFAASLLAPLEMATVYSVTVREGLKSQRGRLIGEGAAFTFQTAPLRLLSAAATVMNRGGVDLRLDFNIPVSPSRLRGFLTVLMNEHQETSYRIASGLAAKTIRATVPVDVDRETFRLTVRLAAGLTGEAGTLGLPEDEVKYFTLTPKLRLTSVRAENAYGGGNILNVFANFGLDAGKASAGGFIKVEPAVPFSVESWYSGELLIRGGFKPRERYVFTFRKGLPSTFRGLSLDEDVVQAVIMPDLPSSVNFAAPGTFLSPAGGGRIPVELVNVRKLELSLWRLYENNIPYIMRSDYSYFDRSLARRAAHRILNLSLPLNEKTRRVVVLDDLLSGDRGLFQLSLLNTEADYWNEQGQIVNLSDIGMAVRLWEDGILVWANTLSALEPVEGADVRVYSAANQLLAEGRTGADGVWQLQRNEPWSGEHESPALATVSRGREVAYVRLTRGLLSQEMFDTSGRPWLRSGCDAALFSARDIYRTGERAAFKAVVRNHDLSTPEPFPVLFVARDPLSRAVKRGTALLGKEGGALFDLDIPDNAMTGLWQVSLYTPGDEERSGPLAWMSFHVEDFAPPRIEVDLNTENTSWPAPDDDVALGISARYLFGADAAGLKWEAAWRAREGVFKPKQEKWAAYTFGNPMRKFAPRGDVFGSGTLSPKGEAETRFTLPADWDAPSVVDLTLEGRVMEEGGRWVSKRVTFPYCPRPVLVGITELRNGAQAVNRAAAFRVAAIAPSEEAEEPADVNALSAELFRVTWNYNLVNVDGYTRWQSSEEYSKVDAKEIAVAGGVGEVSFTPRLWGTYVLVVSDAKSGASASVRFWADDPEYAGQEGSQLLDRVEITTDKDLYKIGDVAKVTLRAPFEGLLLFDVEAAKLIRRDIVKVDKAGTVLEVPVTEEMFPNAWCAAWLIRPVAENEAWGTHRAIGIKRLNVDTGTFRLNVGLDAPAKCDPAGKIPVTLSLKDSRGEPVGGEVALALVDDGVLGLTGFKTPDLLNHFLAPRKMNSDGFDIYDQLMPLETKATELLHPAGGLAEEMAAFAGAPKAQRFKILSLFEGTLAADESGVLKTELDLPEFSGRGRLFAVAVSGARFGSAERTIQIARDIVTEADLPRFAAPGDIFTVPVTVFNSSAEAKDVTVELSAEGGLSVAESPMMASVPANGSRKWTAALEALHPGTAVYKVKTLWNESESARKSYEQRIEMPVRSPFPVVTLSGSGTFQSGDAEIDIRAVKNFAEEGLTGSLVLSDTPLVDLSRAVDFLAHYPYGCLEQTLSGAWPFLILPDAIAEIDPLLIQSDSVRHKTDSAIARLQMMQLYDGSFVKWPGDTRPYAWGSVHAAHFLAEARKAGIRYPEEMFTASLNWVKRFMASLPPTLPSDSDLIGTDWADWTERNDMTAKAYAAYVLALCGEKPLGWIQFLKENESKMWPSGRIWLAGARSLLEGRADALRALGEWSDAVPAGALHETLDSAVRNAAQLLSLWTEVEPRSPEAAKLVQRLLLWGRENRWYSTQENAAVAMALGRYLLKVGRAENALEGALTDGDRPLLAFRSGTRAAIDLKDLPKEPSLRIRTTGTGGGYYSWTATGTPLSAPEPARSGVSVESFWTDREGVPFPEGEPIPQGTEVVVTLRLSPSLSVSDLAVSCLLPAGMEIENPWLADGGEPPLPGVRYSARDDRLLLFIDRLSKETDYRFVMRTVTRGTFAQPLLSAEGMYDPGIRFIGKTSPPRAVGPGPDMGLVEARYGALPLVGRGGGVSDR